MAFTCKQETSDKRIANRSPYFTVLQYINNTETQTFPKMTFHRQESQFFFYPFFTVFLIIKTSSQNISITLLKILLKSHEHRGCYCWKNLP